MSIQTINPSTGQVIKTYQIAKDHAIKSCIDNAGDAFGSWRKKTFNQRGQYFLELIKLLLERKERYAKLMAQEMGKPITFGVAEIEKCAWVCKHYALHAENYLKERIIHTEMQKNYVCYQPLGVIFSIMPWNYPFWQVFRFTAPNLMAGNVTILKHAPISSGSGEAIAQLFTDAGFPSGVFQNLILDNPKAATIIAHPKIAGVTLTGSEQTGRIVAGLAGQNLKKCVMELGGNDPYIILEDADITLATECVVKSRLSNTGQVCIAAKRIIVMDKIYAAFKNALLAYVKTYKMGDPLKSNTTLGPMARQDLREKVQQQVDASVASGAKLIVGGTIPAGKGFYYPPTVLENVHPAMPAFDEEVFGPVIALIKVATVEEALTLANQSIYGLAAAVFTEDVKKGEKLAQAIEAGTCVVNTLVSSDPRVPFGGIKRSGIGRELSKEGILEFVNKKSIGIA